MDSVGYEGKGAPMQKVDSIGARLRGERERLGLSQDAFAKACGVHRRTQVNYELNKRTLPGDYLESISQLGIDAIFVMSGARVDFGTSESQIAAFVLQHLLGALGIRGEPSEIQRLAEAIQDAVVNAEAAGDVTPTQAVFQMLPLVSPTLRMSTTQRSVESAVLPGVLLAGGIASGNVELVKSAVRSFDQSEKEQAAQLMRPGAQRLLELLPWCDDETIDALIGMAYRRRLDSPILLSASNDASRMKSVVEADQPRERGQVKSANRHIPKRRSSKANAK